MKRNEKLGARLAKVIICVCGRAVLSSDCKFILATMTAFVRHEKDIL
jgi:hypothetical protein